MKKLLLFLMLTGTTQTYCLLSVDGLLGGLFATGLVALAGKKAYRIFATKKLAKNNVCSTLCSSCYQ